MEQNRETTIAAERLAAAVAAVPARLADVRGASEKESADRSAYRTPRVELQHARLQAQLAHLVAEIELDEAKQAALAAGLGAPEEQEHPGRFASSELGALLAPHVMRRLELEEQLAANDAAAVEVVEAMQGRRDAVAAAPRLAGLPAVGEVPTHMYEVLIEAERQRRSGQRDEKAIANAASWRSGMGAPEVPQVLVGRPDELLRAALLGERPKGPHRHAGALRRIENEIAQLEVIAGNLAAEKAKRDKETAERRRDYEDGQRRQRGRADAEAAEWRATQAKTKAENDAKRDAGRRAIAEGTVPEAEPFGNPPAPASPPGWRTL